MTTSKQVKDWLQLTIDRRAGRTGPQQEAEEACARRAIELIFEHETLVRRLNDIYNPYSFPPEATWDALDVDEALADLRDLQKDYPCKAEEA